MRVLRLLVLGFGLLMSALAFAQTTYRWVDAAGQTVFSDQAPPLGAKQVVKINNAISGDEQQLSYAMRQAVEKFPVVLYTTSKCADVCAQARAFLNDRGVPFSERSLASEEEMAELEKILGSAAAIPSITVGRQSFKGFEAGAWNNLLELATYPKSASYGSKRPGAK
jgi:hypothetical protein